MRAIYLIRHGEPALKDNRKYCLGRTDLPLSEKGILQAEQLQELICGIPDRKVLSSPLSRATDTCRHSGAGEFEVREGFSEIDTGEWDGLSFDEIRRSFPAEFEARGQDLWNTAPPGGESFAECFERASAELKKVLEENPAGNLVIFTHDGVMKTLNAYLTGSDRFEALKKNYPYGSAACYLTDGKEAFEGPVILPGSGAGTMPDEEECERLLGEYGTPPEVRAHCRAVAEKAAAICRELNRSGAGLDEDAVRAGALLHDIARTERHHAEEGARWLNSKGYPALAALAGDHMELPPEEERISEKSVVFLSDKYVKGTRDVSLYERYFPEDLAEGQREFHKKKYDQAVRIAELFGMDPG